VPAQSTVLVTGATDGIGLATAARLLELGFRVIAHGRTRDSATTCANRLSTRRATVIPVWADFSSMQEVATLPAQISAHTTHLDVMLNNAGMIATRYEMTADGLEHTMAVNYFAPWLLTLRLLPLLLAAPQARVVNVSSMTHAGAELDPASLDGAVQWSAYAAYSSSKLANLLFTLSLSKRQPGMRVNALHPGVISTKLLRQGFGTSGGNVSDGARTSVYLATSKQGASISGRYFVNCKQQRPARNALDEALAEALWDTTAERLTEHLAGVEV